MLSCAAPAAAVMPPAQWPAPAHRAAAAHAAHLLHAPLKEEPMETCPDGGAFSKEHGSGFLSEGFHSASPSSSSKDSHGHSPRSDRGSPPYYEAPPASEFGLQLHFRAGLPCSLLTPPGLAAPAHDRPRLSPYSPEPRAAPPHASTPLPGGRTPPQSPAAGGGASSPDYFRDSGYHASQRFKCEPTSGGGSVGDEADARDASCDATDDGDFEEEPGLRVPAVNSHGKVKTFKCKQCEFVAVTKLSFWEHTKEHIKPEKMLTCPKCPFVTEYKHHLEYHMRNHFGSKPFQCGQCSYSCVNKSMLNSHLKSHSNVYQYRCADCNYATKYCHSLKLHLRKYRHNPAMVLNQDGTPNPLPIIDVYGTRRGPKQKPASKSHDESQGPPPQPPHPLFHNPFAVNFPYSSLLPHPFLFSQNNNYGEAKLSDGGLSPGLVDPTLPPTILQQRLTYGELPPERPQRSPPAVAPSSPPRRSPQLSPPPPRRRSPQHSPPPHSPRTPPPSAPARVALRSPAVADDALDLTSGKHSDTSSPPPPLERSVPLTPTAAMKSRRKGRAFKLQPAALRLQHEEPRPLDVEISGSESDASGGEVAPASATTPPPARPSPPASAAYDCPFCDISFKDLTMHTIHMGFHGYNDPYMCNKCGERSADRVSFFIHLGRAEHA